jgi:hypothetical protein
MRRIGTTEDGILIEVTLEDLAAFRPLCELAGLAQIEAGGRQEEAPRRPRAAVSERKRAARGAVTAAGRSREKACVVCGKAFRDDSRTNVRKTCDGCRDEYTKTAKQRTVENAKASRGSESAFTPRPVKLDPKLKAKRLAAIKEAARRIRERDESLDRPVQHGRVLPVGAQE